MSGTYGPSDDAESLATIRAAAMSSPPRSVAGERFASPPELSNFDARLWSTSPLRRVSCALLAPKK